MPEEVRGYNTYHDYIWSGHVLGAILKAGYAKPTGVQMMCIPLGLACKDVIGVAKTGSGKTCALVSSKPDRARRAPAVVLPTLPTSCLATCLTTHSLTHSRSSYLTHSPGAPNPNPNPNPNPHQVRLRATHARLHPQAASDHQGDRGGWPPRPHHGAHARARAADRG
eukprot:scaffold60873_cov36-Phaeocystis_antarctica.AAC.1